MMRILAIIPARGGSKGVKLKNIQRFAGKPLIVHTILSAKNSKYIDKILVSTDNQKIAKIAKSAGAEVPFLRPKKISRDNILIIEVIKHALNFLKNQFYVPDIVLILQPTSPLRTKTIVDKSVDVLKKSDATSVIAVSKVKTHPYSSFWYDKKYLKPFVPNFKKYSQRQSRPILYYPTGSIYTFWRKTLEKYNSIYGTKIKPLIIEEENNVDIDSKFDFFIGEMKLLYWKKYNKNFRL